MSKDILYKYLVERNPIAQIVIDADGRIVLWNKSAQHLYGYTKDEIYLKKLEDLIFLNKVEIQKQRFFSKTNTTSQKNFSETAIDLKTRDKYQNEIHVKMNFTSIQTEDGDFVMITIRDLTPEDKSKKQLLQKQKELEKYIESNLQLENFTFIASHNLKLPIQNIINFAGYLTKALSERLSKKEAQYLKIIEDNSTRMKEIIQALADYSSISNMPLRLTDISPDSLLIKTLKKLESEVLASGAIIRLGNMPKTIFVDEYLFRQLFSYLIENSLRYTREGIKPEIHIFGTEEKDGYTFCVEDNGIGIDSEFLTSIFGMFKRLHSDKDFEGNGIGLAFCKKIVERHRGSIWVESEEGKGSRFFVKISTLK